MAPNKKLGGAQLKERLPPKRKKRGFRNGEKWGEKCPNLKPREYFSPNTKKRPC